MAQRNHIRRARFGLHPQIVAVINRVQCGAADISQAKLTPNHVDL
jgi:hypothetical protein